MSGTTFKLNDAEIAVLMLPLNGEGGFQHFGRGLQVRLGQDGRIALSDQEVGRVFRYAAYARSDGGFEGRCRKVFGRVLSAPFLVQPGLPGLEPEEDADAA